MQLEQVNALLLERVSMQSEGHGQRERMLEREREFLDRKASFAGKDLPEEVKTGLLGLHEENIQLKEQIRTTQMRLNRAKQFIKDQDKRFREERGKSSTAGGVCNNISFSNDHADAVRSPAPSTKIRKRSAHTGGGSIAVQGHHRNVEGVQNRLFTSSDSKPTPNDDTSGNKRS